MDNQAQREEAGNRAQVGVDGGDDVFAIGAGHGLVVRVALVGLQILAHLRCHRAAHPEAGTGGGGGGHRQIHLRVAERVGQTQDAGKQIARIGGDGGAVEAEHHFHVGPEPAGGWSNQDWEPPTARPV